MYLRTYIYKCVINTIKTKQIYEINKKKTNKQARYVLEYFTLVLVICMYIMVNINPELIASWRGIASNMQRACIYRRVIV